MLSKEERLKKRRDSYANETEEQKQVRRRQSRESYHRHKEKRNLDAKIKRQQPGEAEKAYNHKREYYRANPKIYLLMLAKKRAATDKLEFNINEKDFEIPVYCPILNVELLPVFSKMKERDRVPALDRIDNSKGYIKGNVQVISFKANRNKSDMSIDDIKRLYKYIGETWEETH